MAIEKSFTVSLPSDLADAVQRVAAERPERVISNWLVPVYLFSSAPSFCTGSQIAAELTAHSPLNILRELYEGIKSHCAWPRLTQHIDFMLSSENIASCLENPRRPTVHTKRPSGRAKSHVAEILRAPVGKVSISVNRCAIDPRIHRL